MIGSILDNIWGIVILIIVLKYGMPIADMFFKSTMRNLEKEMKDK